MLITCLDMPFIASIPVFGIGMIGIAFQVSFFQAVILAKVRKPGASIISSLVLGLFHVVFAPQMILFAFIGGLIGEVLGLLILRSYKSYLSIGFTSCFLVPVITLCMRNIRSCGFVYCRSCLWHIIDAYFIQKRRAS